MSPERAQPRASAVGGLRRASNAVIGRGAALLLRALRLTNPDIMGAMFGWLMRRVGPFLREHRIGRENLAAAFPEKSGAEIERILAGVWENLGRVAAEFAHLDRLYDYDPAKPDGCRVGSRPEMDAIFERLRDDGKPALIFAPHLANWELPAVAAKARGLAAATLYRRPNMTAVADAIVKLRRSCMGTLISSGPGAPFILAHALEQGAHVAMLVDQHYERGVKVVFFGRPCKANPMLARLARHYDCPIHGTRAVRLPGNRFRVELSPALEVPRDADGRVNVEGTMQAITSLIETWVREHPEQWLWLHRRWR
jgi:KDO2-lipid IV(A) lauroyltransferase